jgi:hypothetical protein
VFLHQESVRGLLTDEPRVRDEALDRLFGLEKLRDVLAAIPVSVVKDAVEEIQSKKQRATDKLSGAAAQAEQTRRMHLKEAMDRIRREGPHPCHREAIVSTTSKGAHCGLRADGQETPALPANGRRT